MAKEKLEEIFKHIADSEDLTNYEIIYPQMDGQKGDGFLSECFTGEIINKDTGFKINAFVKVSVDFMEEFTSYAYCNEYRFYKDIFPELNKFQSEKRVKDPFKNIPKFYCGSDKGHKKYVVIENLTVQNYALSDKSQTMNEDHFQVLFKTYGKFHALSFAFKEQHLEKYLELLKPLKNLYGGKFGEILSPPAKKMFTEAYSILKEINVDASKKLEPIKNNFEEFYETVATYDGKYCGLSHGDCWSNNMLFKNGENGKVEDVKTIDFQLCRESTPVHDLSYFFYASASKKDLDKLDEYLDLYYKSFSAFAKELGSDPEKLLPFSILKSDWKKYSLLGVFMGIMLWQSKLVSKENVEEFLRTSGQEGRTYFNLVLKSEAFKKNTSSILLHAIEYGII